MSMYIIRNIDPNLWERFKAKTKADEMPMKAVILKLVAMYADGRITLSARRAPPPAKSPEGNR